MYGATYDWHTLEGPAVRRRDGTYYCFYSGGSWLTEGYARGLGVGAQPARALDRAGRRRPAGCWPPSPAMSAGPGTTAS